MNCVAEIRKADPTADSVGAHDAQQTATGALSDLDETGGELRFPQESPLGTPPVVGTAPPSSLPNPRMDIPDYEEEEEEDFEDFDEDDFDDEFDDDFEEEFEDEYDVEDDEFDSGVDDDLDDVDDDDAIDEEFEDDDDDEEEEADEEEEKDD